jgi:hypothetical protein
VLSPVDEFQLRHYRTLALLLYRRINSLLSEKTTHAARQDSTSALESRTPGPDRTGECFGEEQYSGQNVEEPTQAKGRLEYGTRFCSGTQDFKTTEGSQRLQPVCDGPR